MSTVLEQRSLPEAEAGRWRPWLAIAAGLLALYVPTYLSLAQTLWREDQYAHGPIILAVFLWLVWRKRDALLENRGQTSLSAMWKPRSVPGFLLVVFGLAMYVVGRSQALPLFEVASHAPVLVGVLLMMRGPRAVRALGFALLFLVFLIPLPGFILEGATTPLKAMVSAAVAHILGFAGYAVERAGVVLNVGGHEMLVADACSGLNSLYSLTALSLLYAYLTGPSSKARIAILLLAIVPIAIAANIVRVLFLVLVAYHLGDEAAQGILHSIAGMLLFVTAFGLLIAVDRVIPKKSVIPTKVGIQPERVSEGLDSRLRGNDVLVAIVAAFLMIGAAVAAPTLKPVPAEGAALDLERLVPSAFGDWSIDPTIVPIAPTPEVQAKLDRIYSHTLSRSYVNARGEQMMLTLAYGGDQSDALKAHRQEVCYTAQGFEIHGLHAAQLETAGRSIPVTRMLAVRAVRSEPVTYWFTMGDRVVRGRVERLGMQLASGLRGRIPDGMLVRVSSISGDAPSAYAAQQAFIAALLAAMPATEAARIAGAERS